MNLDQIASDIRKEFTLNAKGHIANAGKFEGEPLWIAYFYNKGLLGFSDWDDGKQFKFVITKDDRDLFPDIPPKRRVIYVWEDPQGFVRYW